MPVFRLMLLVKVIKLLLMLIAILLDLRLLMCLLRVPADRLPGWGEIGFCRQKGAHGYDPFLSTKCVPIVSENFRSP